jgi:alpha-ketoglutaric semialdehyde dehydrogenase
MMEYNLGARNMQPTLLAGEWVGAASDEWFEDRDPADTREIVALLPRLSGDQITAAIETADRNAGVWAGASPIDRGRVLFEAARLIRERVDDIATDVLREAGKLQEEARAEVLKSADFLEYYGGVGRLAQGTVLPDERPGTFAHTLIEPLGVVLLITAWNDPVLTPARKIGPALIAGNSVVIKPSEDTPLSSLHLARALLDAGLPPSSLSVVVGHPADVAEPLLGHSAIRAVSFTGSTRTGRLIKERLSDRNVRFQAEMGGKNAVVVLPDVDLEEASLSITAAAYAQAGQRCTATSRVIAVGDPSKLKEALIGQAREVRVGPGWDPESQMGPLINPIRLEEVSAAVQEGIRKGDRVLWGGERASGEKVAHGCFLEPTVVAVDSPLSPLWREEVFGPVLAIASAPDFDSAVEGVNDSVYGLSAAVFTRDLAMALEFVRRVDVGQVAVNRPTSGWDVHLPFGGFGESGSWSKEQGLEGIDFYTKVKTIAIGYRS